jgi:methylmalonyl-CoA mutase
VIGVNTFLSSEGSPTVLPKEVIRSTQEEKDAQIAAVAELQARCARERPAALERLRQVALHNGNVFAELMETTKTCTLGEIGRALFEVGGQYRRNM